MCAGDLHSVSCKMHICWFLLDSIHNKKTNVQNGLSMNISQFESCYLLFKSVRFILIVMVPSLQRTLID